MARKSSPENPRHGGPDARAEAMRLLAEGLQVSSVAKLVGVNRCTVRVWRDSPDGQRELDAARKARAAQFLDAADQARRILREAAPKAAQTIVDRLDSKVPFEGISASDQLLARIGLPRSTVVEQTPEEEYDLSRLDHGEAAQLEALLAKAKKVT